MDAPTDYFGLYGYRALALAVITQALDDLVQTRDEQLRREAMDWIDWVPSKSPGRHGLTFVDCIAAAGASSGCERFRERCKSDPQGLRHDLLCYSRGVQSESRYANAVDDDLDRPAFDTQELLRSTTVAAGLASAVAEQSASSP